MPLYDYLCERNGKTIEVRHGMTESIETWGDLCQRSGRPPGETPPDTPVRKLIGTGNALNRPGTLAKTERPRDCATQMPMRDHKY